MGFLGEYSADSSPLFFLIAFALMGVSFLMGEKVYLPLKSTIHSFFLVFVLVLLLCTAINLPDILGYYFKHTSGLNRFMRQFLSIGLAYSFLILFLNIARNLGGKRFFYATRRVMLISLAIVFSCGFIEFLILNLNIVQLIPIIKLYGYLPFVDISLDFHLYRVAATTYEPPALGTFLITIFGFMFSYIFTSKRKIIKYLPALMVLFLALVSKSRTAFVVIAFELIVGIGLAYLKDVEFRRLANKVGLIALGIAIVLGSVFSKTVVQKIESRIASLNFTTVEYSKANYSISNKSRMGIQYALIQTFKQKPVFGTGWGQQAYISRFEYPNWAVKDNYEFPVVYQNKHNPSFPPGFNLYLRILAETGVVGFAAYLLFLVTIGISLLNYYRNHRSLYLSVALIMTISGFCLNWLQIDSFRMYGFWIGVAILMVLIKEKELRFNNL